MEPSQPTHGNLDMILTKKLYGFATDSIRGDSVANFYCIQELLDHKQKNRHLHYYRGNPYDGYRLIPEWELSELWDFISQ